MLAIMKSWAREKDGRIKDTKKKSWWIEMQQSQAILFSDDAINENLQSECKSKEIF